MVGPGDDETLPRAACGALGPGLSDAKHLHHYRDVVRFLVLGSARAVRGEELVELGARKPRSIVAALAMTPGRPVSAELLADLVWAGEPPRAAHGALHSYLSGLRRALEPDRPVRGTTSVIETTDHGYVLRVPAEDVDAHTFAATAARAERTLAPLAGLLTGTGPDRSWPGREEVLQVLAELDEAVAAWVGEPYADLPDHPDVLAARAGLEQQRFAVGEARLLGLLALGEHASVLASTEPATGPGQLSERMWALHAVALARAGRQADALQALSRVRTVLADELGLDPGPELRALQDALLRQEPGLQAVLPTAPLAVIPGPRPDALEPRPATGAPMTVGREEEWSALLGCLDRGQGGTAAWVALVGEPGIGKSHLVDRFVAEARGRGLRVGVGRCARDDGAPPLWPWRQALAELGIDGDLAGEETAESPEQRAFRVSERVASLLRAAVAERPAVLVLEDLHWADDATLRALTRLLDSCPADAPLCVLVTRRAHPEPLGTLATVGEALARRHGVRLDLAGLDPAAGRDLVRSGGVDVGDDVAERWRQRAAGNPFFLIELARLSEPGSQALPPTVLDVLGRRLAELPEPVVERLRTVAAADDTDPDEVADQLDVAVDAGLVREVGPEQYAFAHALTQEAVVASMSGTRAARRHARVARALQVDAGLMGAEVRVAELARHWLAAGPSHVEAAWPAARAAAEQASRLTSYPEALRWRRAAVEAHRRVVGATDELHHELLLELANEAAYAAQWPDVEQAAFEAMTLGRTLGSPALVGSAAGALTRYCVWLPHVMNAVFEDAVDDLRWALAHVGEDTATRCRLQLSLAVELYYEVEAAAERRALVESGMVLARSLDDPRLTWEMASAAVMVAWTPSQLEDRLAWAAEGVTAARRAGDVRAEAVLLVQLAIAHAEAGDLASWEEASEAAAAIARRERLVYVLMTLQWQWLANAALRGRPDEVQVQFDALTETVPQVAVPAQELMLPYAWVAARLWDPALLGEVVGAFAEEFADHSDGGVVVHELLAKVGLVEELRQVLAEFPLPVQAEYWCTLSDWGREAEAAAVAGDVPLARRAIEELTPYRGRMQLQGAAGVSGIVDASLALAHATVGDLATASELAGSARARAREWELTAYERWLDDHRARLGF